LTHNDDECNNVDPAPQKAQLLLHPCNTIVAQQQWQQQQMLLLLPIVQKLVAASRVFKDQQDPWLNA